MTQSKIMEIFSRYKGKKFKPYQIRDLMVRDYGIRPYNTAKKLKSLRKCKMLRSQFTPGQKDIVYWLPKRMVRNNK